MGDWSWVPGAVIGGRYRIDAPLGEGGFGAVFVATQLAVGRAVALKVLRPELCASSAMVARFEREVELVKRLEHPHTVRLLEVGRAADGSPFLVFELLRGRTLAATMIGEGAMPAARVARIASQVLKSLMEAHELGIVHRDIKPPNIFLSEFHGETDFVKVLDFGIAKGSSLGPLTEPGAVLGTPAYMAPEQIHARAPTFASDLYALGISMSEALSGEPLFRHLPPAEAARLQISPAPVPHRPAALASPLCRVILRATEKAPQARYPSAAAMLADLEAAMIGVAPTLMAGPVAVALTPALPETHVRPPGPAPDWGTLPRSPALPLPGQVTFPESPAMAVTQLAVTPGAPQIPAAAPRRRAPSRAPLVAALAGAGALATALIVALVVSGPGPRGGLQDRLPGPLAPRKNLPHVRLAQLTTEMMIERAEDAGYEVVSNQAQDMKSIRTQSISLRKGSRQGTVVLYHFDDVRAARATMDSFSQQDSGAVSTEGTIVLFVQMANGTERGNRASTEVLRAIVR